MEVIHVPIYLCSVLGELEFLVAPMKLICQFPRLFSLEAACSEYHDMLPSQLPSLHRQTSVLRQPFQSSIQLL